jgi:release factor glutamine methyltransferase
LVKWCTEYLRTRGVEEGRLDVELLLAETLGMDRLSLYLHFDRPISPEELKDFKPRLLERAGHRPLQYILGRASFREVVVDVDSRVLIPRPETEELVEAVLGWARGEDGERQRARKPERVQGLRALEIGTGSGVIAISLAVEGPFERIVATDQSRDALELAGGNVAKYGLGGRVDLREGSFFDPIASDERFDLVVSNPPYVTEEEYSTLPPEIREWEPKGALVAWDGSFGAVSALIAGAGGVLETGGLLAMEIGAGQGEAVLARIRETSGYEAPVLLRDHSRRDRIVLAEWRG